MLASIALLLAPAVADAAPRISLSQPQPRQVIQRDRTGRGDIRVAGRCTDGTPSVRVRWGGDAVTLRCGPDGRFRGWLRGVPAGQATLVARSLRTRSLAARAALVGVGDIYVVAGQSNASGRSTLRFRETDPRFSAAMFGNDDRWRPLRDPVDSPVGQKDRVSGDSRAGGSVWPGVATLLMDSERVPVAFVPCACGATSIERWLPAPEARLSTATLYGSMLRRIGAVGGRVRAVLFWQGEADARRGITLSAYRTLLGRFGRSVARDCRTRVVVAQIGDFNERGVPALGVDAVRVAQMELWGTRGIVRGPSLYDIDLGGRAHFNDEEDVSLAARRWAAAILAGVLRRPVPRPPRFRSAVYDGASNAIVVRTDRPTLRTGEAGGIVVRAGGVPVAIREALVTAAGTITLTLEGPVAGALTVSLGGGRTAAGAAVPVERSRWSLPMDLFLDEAVASGPPEE